MEKKLKLNKFIFYFIIFQPIIDLMTSLFVRNQIGIFSIGTIVRALFLVAILLITFFSASKKQKIAIITFIGIVVLYGITFLSLSYIDFGMTGLLTQCQDLIKTFFYPIILICFLVLYKNDNLKISSKCFSFSLFLYGIIIFFSAIFDIDYYSYNEWTYGTVGLFYAANEIGMIVSLLGAIIIVDCYNINKINSWSIFTIINFLLYIFTSTQLGTKTPFFIMCAYLLLFVLFLIYKLFMNKNKFNLIKLIVVLLFCVFLLFGIKYSNVGKNLNINFQADIINILGINSTSPDDSLNSEDESEDNQNPSINDLNILLSSRDIYKAEAKKSYGDANIARKIIGLGYVEKIDGEIINRKLAEMEYFDILYSNGWIGFIIYFLPVMGILIYGINIVLKNIKKIMLNFKILILIASIALAYISALLVGHVFTAPAVSTILTIIIIYTLIEIDKLIGKEK